MGPIDHLPGDGRNMEQVTAEENRARIGALAAPALTASDRRVITKAAELGAIHSPDALCEYTGYRDSGEAYAAAFSHAQILLAEQAAIITRLAGEQP